MQQVEISITQLVVKLKQLGFDVDNLDGRDKQEVYWFIKNIARTGFNEAKTLLNNSNFDKLK